MNVPPCPLCGSEDIQLMDDVNPSKRSCKCRKCGCSALASSWVDRKVDPWKVIGYSCFGPEGEWKFIIDRKMAGILFDLGWIVNAIFMKEK